MITINISLPDRLKEQIDALVGGGYYASISDLARDAFRQTVKTNIFDLMGDEAERAYANGRVTVLKSNKDIDKYLDRVVGDDANNHDQ